MYLGMVGSTAKQKKKRLAAGGGGSASVSVATSSSGNFNNAVKVGLLSIKGSSPLGSTSDYDYSDGVEDGSNSTFGTASSPTRTTQSVDFEIDAYLTEYSNNPRGGVPIIIGGYIRNNGFTPANNYKWELASSVVSSDMSNGGASIIIQETDLTSKNRQNNQDNTAMNTGTTFPKGIYGGLGLAASGTSNYFRARIAHGGGRGSSSLPAAGDTFTLRITVENQDTSGTTYTAIHDLTVNFT